MNGVVSADDAFTADIRGFATDQNNFGPILGRNQGALGNIVFRPRSDLVISAELRTVPTFPVLQQRQQHKSSQSLGGDPVLTTGSIARSLTMFLRFRYSAALMQQTLKAHVDITRNGHRLKDASEAVVWLSPLGGMRNSPSDSQIPNWCRRTRAFILLSVVIPVGGKVEFPNHDPFFHNVFSLFEGKRFDLGLV